MGKPTLAQSKIILILKGPPSKETDSSVPPLTMDFTRKPKNDLKANKVHDPR